MAFPIFSSTRPGSSPGLARRAGFQNYARDLPEVNLGSSLKAMLETCCIFDYFFKKILAFCEFKPHKKKKKKGKPFSIQTHGIVKVGFNKNNKKINSV